MELRMTNLLKLSLVILTSSFQSDLYSQTSTIERDGDRTITEHFDSRGLDTGSSQYNDNVTCPKNTVEVKIFSMAGACPHALACDKGSNRVYTILTMSGGYRRQQDGSTRTHRCKLCLHNSTDVAQMCKRLPKLSKAITGP